MVKKILLTTLISLCALNESCYSLPPNQVAWVNFKAEMDQRIAGIAGMQNLPAGRDLLNQLNRLNNSVKSSPGTFGSRKTSIIKILTEVDNFIKNNTPQQGEVVPIQSSQRVEAKNNEVMPIQSPSAPYNINEEVQKFLLTGLETEKDIQDGETKIYITTENYKGRAVLHNGKYLKIPRAHGYLHLPQRTFFAIEFPKSILVNLDADFKKIFGNDVSMENVNVFFMAQNSYEDSSSVGDDAFELRPHYGTDPNSSYNNVQRDISVDAILFSLDEGDGEKIKLENNPSGTIIHNAQVLTHPVEGIHVASPDNLHISGFSKNEGGFFCSVIIYTDNNIKRAILTFHYIKPNDCDYYMMQDGNYANFISTVGEAKKIGDLPIIKEKFGPELQQLPGIIKGMAEKVKW